MRAHFEVTVTGECKILVENASSAAKAIEYAVELMNADKRMGKFRFAGAITKEIKPADLIETEKAADLVSKDDS